MAEPDHFFRKLLICIDNNEYKHLGLLFVLMLCMAGLEVLCALLFVPLLSIIESPASHTKYDWLIWILDIVGSETSTRTVIIASCSAVMCGYLIKNGFNLYFQHYREQFVRRSQASLAYRLLETYITSDYVKFVERNSADLIRNINQDIDKIFSNVMRPALTLLVEAIIMMSILCVLLYQNILITMIAIGIFGVLGTLIYRLSQHYTYFYGANMRRISGQMIKWTVQALGSIKETRVMAKERYFLKRYDENMDEFAHYMSRFAVVREIPRLGLEVLGIGTVLIMTLILLGNSANEQETLPTLGLFAVASFRMLPSINRITTSLTSLRFHKAAVDGIVYDLSEYSNENVTLDEVGALSFDQEIILENVAFSYDEHTPIISECSLTIKKGQHVAFVGASGAGKTTLMDIILGLLTPTQGRVLVDGVDIHTHRRAWQQLVGYISQPVYMLNDTVRRNVAFGVWDEDIMDDEVWHALEHAQLTEVIHMLPGKLDELIGDAGVKLSGGQRQRLGIARVLYRNPEVLVFDEATSALDNETEAEINRALTQVSHHKTSLIIAHRFSTIRHCHNIFMLADGKVLAQGTYDELMANCPAFYQLATASDIELSLDKTK